MDDAYAAFMAQVGDGNDTPAQPPPQQQAYQGSAPYQNQAYASAPSQNHTYSSAPHQNQAYASTPYQNQAYASAPYQNNSYAPAPHQNHGYASGPSPNGAYASNPSPNGAYTSGPSPNASHGSYSGDAYASGPSPNAPQESPSNGAGEGEVDPLDAFMAELGSGKKKKKKKRKLAERMDLDDANADPIDSYMDMVAKQRAAGIIPLPSASSSRRAGGDGYNSDEDVYAAARAIEKAERAKMNIKEDIELDADGNPIMKKKRKMDLLPAVNHDAIEYAPFKKNFYKEHDDLKNMTTAQKNTILRHLDIRTRGSDVPNPCVSFAYFGLSRKLMDAIQKQEFEKPTAIQAQAVPCAMSGRDVIGIAKTGSGKTAAFLWPMISHILDQDHLGPHDGPIAMVMGPTRELAKQIYEMAVLYMRCEGIRVCPVYGGMNMHEQVRTLEKGVEVIVGTPGRIMDILRKKATNCQRITYVVIDEVDRLFDMGFEKQLRAIVGQTRPDRQTLMFSATFSARVESLAKTICGNPVRINIGRVGAANKDIRQVVDIVPSQDAKWSWLLSKVWGFLEAGPMLIFVAQIKSAELLNHKLKQNNINAGVIHGDCSQYDRQAVLKEFKASLIKVLVATDVAARGLDIKGLKTVVQYDCPKNIDTHVHRIGRTGRAGEDGIAYTLLTDTELDRKMSKFLIRNLRDARQPISRTLVLFAQNRSDYLNPENEKFSKLLQNRSFTPTGANAIPSASSSSAPGAPPGLAPPPGLSSSSSSSSSAGVPRYNAATMGSQQAVEATDEEIDKVLPDEPRGGRTMNAKRPRGKNKSKFDMAFVKEGRKSAMKGFKNSFVSAKSSGKAGNLFTGEQKGEVLAPLRPDSWVQQDPAMFAQSQSQSPQRARRSRFSPAPTKPTTSSAPAGFVSASFSSASPAPSGFVSASSSPSGFVSASSAPSGFVSASSAPSGFVSASAAPSGFVSASASSSSGADQSPKKKRSRWGPKAV